VVAALVLSCALGTARADALFDHALTPRQLVDTVLAGVAGKMAATRVLTGSFVQRRQINGLPRPLVSSGDFLLARDAGIVWRTRTPFESTLVLAPDGMTLRSGGVEQHVTVAEQPALQAALGMLFAMFAMDLGRLDAGFALFGQSQGATWRVGLRPRGDGLSQVFTSAVISGSAQVDRIELSTAAGDTTTIEFSGVAARSTALEPAEAVQFRR
jgi:hypothetical protein